MVATELSFPGTELYTNLLDKDGGDRLVCAETGHPRRLQLAELVPHGATLALAVTFTCELDFVAQRVAREGMALGLVMVRLPG